MSDIRDFSGKNRKFTGTNGVKLPSGTAAQRVDEAGRIRFNTDTNLAEYYDGTDWKSIDAPPTITGFTIDGGSSVTSSFIDRTAGGTSTFVISGSNFDTTSGTVIFEPESGGSNISVQSITRTNSSQFTVTATRSDFIEANDPYAIKLTNGSGLAATLASAIDVNVPPAFATAADTNLGTVQNGDTATQYDANLTTAAATDADGDAITHTISAGTLPNGMSIEADGTFTGTASSLSTSATDRTFTVQAATSKGTTTRQFVITEIASTFVGATGGTVVTNGDYKTHVFTSPGNFVVSTAGASAGSNSVEYMVVAGGAGGSGSHGGGGGAGGFRHNYPSPTTGGLSVSAQTYPVTVGGGGSGKGPGPGGSANIIGGSGGQSVFSSITSAGGGGGAYSEDNDRPGTRGNDGGSGGGGGGGGSGGGGTGNTPPVSPPQGNNGGSGYGSPIYNGGGGGGAGGAGQTQGPAQPGGAAGIGAGLSTTFIPSSYGTSGPAGSTRYFAGGGGGGVHSGNGHASAPPSGGGGAGGTNANNNPGDSATANTGGGGGGSNGQNGTSGAGGSGIVAIRYKFQ